MQLTDWLLVEVALLLIDRTQISLTESGFNHHFCNRTRWIFLSTPDPSVEDPQNVLPASCHLTQVAILDVGSVNRERRIEIEL
jgi:hypothetical protein